MKTRIYAAPAVKGLTRLPPVLEYSGTHGNFNGFVHMYIIIVAMAGLTLK